jgi:hypothetical protein
LDLRISKSGGEGIGQKNPGTLTQRKTCREKKSEPAGTIGLGVFIPVLSFS